MRLSILHVDFLCDTFNPTHIAVGSRQHTMYDEQDLTIAC
jgi:hypothetical protein